MKKHLSFKSVVLKNEFKSISGKWYKTIIFLSLLTSSTFLCIGFADKAEEIRLSLIKDPFSNLIPIFIPNSPEYLMDTLRSSIRTLNDDHVRKSFLIHNVYQSKQYKIITLNRRYEPENNINNEDVIGMTINPGSSLLPVLLDSFNLVKRHCASGDVFKKEPFGWIVTERLIKRLGFHNDSIRFLMCRNDSEHDVPVKILGIVKDLPNRSDVLCTDTFKVMQNELYKEDSIFDRLFFETVNLQEIKQISRQIREKFNISEDSVLIDKTAGITILSYNKANLETYLRYKNLFKSLGLISEFTRIQYGTFYYPVTVFSETTKEHIRISLKNLQRTSNTLVIELTRIDSISNFADFLKNRFNILIEIETVKQKQNFLLALYITGWTINLIFFISIVFILLFIFDSLHNHLEKIKRNLGNFRAFGASRHTILFIYARVILKIILISLVIASAIAYVAGELFEKYRLPKLIYTEKDHDYFALFNTWYYSFIIGIIVLGLFITITTVWVMMMKTPGDLIYERKYSGNTDKTK